MRTLITRQRPSNNHSARLSLRWVLLSIVLHTAESACQELKGKRAETGTELTDLETVLEKQRTAVNLFEVERATLTEKKASFNS